MPDNFFIKELYRLKDMSCFMTTIQVMFVDESFTNNKNISFNFTANNCLKIVL